MKKLSISTIAKMAVIDQLDIPADEQTILYVEGYASVNYAADGSKNIDRDGEVYDIPSLKIDNYMKTGPIVANHNWNVVMGKAVTLEKTIRGLYLKAEVHKVPGHEDIFYGVQKGLIQSFSISAIPQSMEYLDTLDAVELRDAELVEISILPVPSNAQSTFSVTHSKALTMSAKSFAEQNDLTMCELKGLCKTKGKSVIIEKEKEMEIKTKDVEVKAESKVEVTPEVKAESKVEVTPEVKEEPKVEVTPEVKEEPKAATFDEAALVAAIDVAETRKAQLLEEQKEQDTQAEAQRIADEAAVKNATIAAAYKYVQDQQAKILSIPDEDFDTDKVDEFYELVSNAAEAIEGKVASIVKAQAAPAA